MSNPVAEAIKRLGGITPAIIRTGYSQSTLYYWRGIGRVVDARAAFIIADLTGISVRLLVGMSADTPDGGTRTNKAKKKEKQACEREIALEVSSASATLQTSAVDRRYRSAA